jgi:hypothetical protein
MTHVPTHANIGNKYKGAATGAIYTFRGTKGGFFLFESSGGNRHKAHPNDLSLYIPLEAETVPEIPEPKAGETWLTSFGSKRLILGVHQTSSVGKQVWVECVGEGETDIVHIAHIVSQWTKVEPFFKVGEIYSYPYGSRSYKIIHVGKVDGIKYAVRQNVSDPGDIETWTIETYGDVCKTSSS